MKDLDKTKGQLIKELQEIRRKLISVTALESTEEVKLKQVNSRLLESAERLDFFVENSPLAIIEWDSNFVVTKWTGNSEKIFGWSSDETIGVPVMDLNMIYEPDISIVQNSIDMLIHGVNKHVVSVNRNYRKDKKIIYCEWHNTALKDQNGNLLYVLSEVLDITERKQAELLLKESEERLFTAQEVAKVGSWETNLSTMEVIWSDETYRIFGLDRNKFKTTHPNFLTSVHPDDREEVDRAFIKSFRTNHVNSIKHRIITPDGSIKFIEERWRIYFNNNGQPDHAVGTCRDITDITKAQQQNTMLKHSLDVFTDGVYWMDSDNKFIYVNEAGGKSLGYDASELLGKSLWDVNPTTTAETLENLWNKLRTDGTFTAETVHKRQDGTLFIVEIRTTYFKYEGKEYNYGFARDITDRKRIEEDLITAKENAEESDRLKTAFIANMSHEIRTPMNGILGFAELLKEPNLSGEEQREYIRIIEKSGARMLNIINDIIDISKIEAGLMKVNMNESNVNSQIDYIYTFFKPEVEMRGMKLIRRNSLPDDDAVIKTDREKLFAILTNLVKNAIKYSDKGVIEFGYEKKGEYLEFYVKDTGIGIRKERLTAIFERFVQEDVSDVKARQGAGLGLAITKSYVEMLGGEIWVESEIGIGSTFFFTIPFDQAKDKQLSQWKRSIKHYKSHNATLKILIVEDDEISERLITKGVRVFGKEILKAKSGDQAIEICRNNSDIDLILMDIQLPVLGGYEAVRKIRQFNKDVVIIAQTAFGLVGDREKAKEAGCNDYLSKPVNKSELHLLIRKHCNKKFGVSHGAELGNYG